MEITSRDAAKKVTAKDIEYDEYNNADEITSRETTQDTEDYNTENEECGENNHNSEEMVFENVSWLFRRDISKNIEHR